MTGPADTITVVPGGPGDSARKVAVRRYFRLTPRHIEEQFARGGIWFGGILAVVAVSFLLVGLATLGVIIGTVAVVVALYGWRELAVYRYRRKRALPEPSDAAMDDVMERNLAEMATRGMERLGVTPDQLILTSAVVGAAAFQSGLLKPRLAEQADGPLVILGPILTSPRRIGNDGTWRYARNVVMVICATQLHLRIYRCEVELALGHPENEETHEYYYRDVMAIQTVTRPWGPFSILGPEGQYVRTQVTGHERELYITVPSAEAAHMVIGLREFGHPDHDVHLQETGIGHVIDALRSVLEAMK